MIIDVKQYGALGDGIVLDTKGIQRAIDYCSDIGGEVVFSPGIYLTGTIILKSNVTVNIQKGAVVLGSTDFKDYKSDIRPFVDAVGQERGRCIFFGDNAHNVAIKGEGIINGRGEAFGENHPEHKRRPFLFRFVECRNLTVQNISIRNSPAWCMHFLDCEDVSVKGISIISRVNHNNDGMDIDSCRNFVIEDSFVDTGDDGICLKSTVNKSCSNIVVKNCVISSRWAGLKIGTESYGDFKDISVLDCRIYDTEGCAIKLVPVDGANLENLVIRNITMINCTGPIFIALGERLKTYFEGDKPREIGSIKNVTIKGIKADVKDAEGFKWNPGELKGFITHDGIWGNGKAVITLSGIPSKKIENIVLEDLDLILPGGGSKEDGERTEIIEMGENYPEFHVFGTLPAYGIFIRHADGVKISNIKLRVKEKDERAPIVYQDAHNINISEVLEGDR
jgi:polygalacturonase